MRDGESQGEAIHNTLLTDEEIEARARRVNPRARGVPDLRAGAQRLDVRFTQFENVVIELLQYRDADKAANAGSFAEPLDHMSPAFPRMMHICFHVRDDVDLATASRASATGLGSAAGCTQTGPPTPRRCGSGRPRQSSILR